MREINSHGGERKTSEANTYKNCYITKLTETFTYKIRTPYNILDSQKDL